MVDVFISYARENQGFAQRIAEAVRREGYSVFWDDDLPPHLSYGEVITEKIGDAKAAIVVWSHEAAESEWVRAEADLARSQKKLIQTSIDDRLPPMPFNQIQFASIGDWNGEADHPGWRKVRASLAALAGGDAAAAGTRPMGWATSPTPPPISSVPPPVRSRSNGPLIAVLVGGLVLLAAVGGGLYWMRSQPGEDPEVVAGAAAPGGAGNASVAQASPTAGPRPSTARFTQAAVIEDPDGYTNVRSGPAESFPVVARVNRGEVFTTYPQGGEWWQVRTADSRVGYMAASRIRLIQPGEAAAASAGAAAPAEPTVAAAAEPVAASPPRAPPPRQVFPDSSLRRLAPREVAGLSPAQLRMARNEIFARHGRPFRDPQLRAHFERYPWYRPRPGAIALNAVEQANLRLLQQAERK